MSCLFPSKSSLNRLLIAGSATVIAMAGPAYASAAQEPVLQIAQFQELQSDTEDTGDAPSAESDEPDADDADDAAASDDSESEEAELTLAEETGFIWQAEKTETAVVILGAVPSDQFQRFQRVRARGAIDGTAVRDDVPDSFASDALAALDALALLETGIVFLDGEGWSIEGLLVEGATQEELAAALDDADTPAEEWTITVAAIAVESVETDDAQPEPDRDEPEIPQEADDEAERQEAEAAARERCAAQVAAFMEDHSILFASGSATLTPESRELMSELSNRLNICPQATIYVEGHTDSVGGDAINLPLSVSRAEAVVDELIAQGVSVNRLYAVGYGSSLPVASNDTAEGRMQNRRIVFTFEDQATILDEEAEE